MADPATGLWGYRALFLALCIAVAFVQLLPLDMGPGQIPGPDVLMLLAFSWVIMRPDYVPVFLIAAVFFLADLLFMRPLGLWTALVVLGAEFLRSRSFTLRDTPFLLEWLLVSGVVTAVFIGNSLFLGLFAVSQPGLGLTLIGLIATILAYPLVVILAGRAFGLRKIVPGEVDRLGHKQ
ncbi:rod shape-determining protein MreD [Silicimonas sp. MF1-12-2]|jgi:rod shape-determining protein MreD|uniref:rod shape-determining protein MreD n=1 Tax=Silicimonas sp. MF1-12-2 TaxID=3384793 RepID=UPI0039B67F1C